MFIAVIFIAIGLALLLNSLGVIAGNFWGFFWAVIFIAIGVKMLNHRKECPFCQWKSWKVKSECRHGDGSHEHYEHKERPENEIEQ